MAKHNHTNANRPAATGRGDGPVKLLAVHFAIVLLVVVDFIMFQAAAAGATAAIYYTVPALDSGIVRGESSWTWIRIFQIVSPTITLPGGAVAVLSSYFFARRAQQVEAQARAEVQQAQEQARVDVQQAQDQMRAEVQEVREQMRAEVQQVREQMHAETQRAQEEARRADAAEARLELRRRPRRRRLRNGATTPSAAR